MNEIEEARKKEIRDQWKMLPLACIAFILLVGLYVLLLQDAVYIKGDPLWGATKGIWFIAVIVLGGLTIAFVCLSLSVLLYIGMLAKNLNARPHPWRPILLSTAILILGYGALSSAMYAELSIRENSMAINDWYEYRIGEGALHWLVSGIWFYTVIFLVSLFIGLIIGCMQLPFDAKKHANTIKERH